MNKKQLLVKLGIEYGMSNPGQFVRIAKGDSGVYASIAELRSDYADETIAWIGCDFDYVTFINEAIKVVAEL